MYKKLLLIAVLQVLFANAELSLYKADVWQHRDSDGTTLPYFTKAFLSELKKWSISEWDIFIWADADCSSDSTLFWFVRKCKSVTHVNWSHHWINEFNKFINERLHLGHKVVFKCREIEHVEREDSLFGKRQLNIMSDFGENSAYVNAILEDNKYYDCVIVDGMHRNSCVEKAIKRIKPGGILILNKSNQFTIGMDNKKAHELLAQYEYHSFLQSGHLDWRTDYWVIN